MAEINIQRKEKSIWPWVLGGIVLILLVLLLAGVFSNREDDYDGRRDADTTAVAPPSEMSRQL